MDKTPQLPAGFCQTRGLKLRVRCFHHTCDYFTLGKGGQDVGLSQIESFGF